MKHTSEDQVAAPPRISACCVEMASAERHSPVLSVQNEPERTLVERGYKAQPILPVSLLDLLC